MAIVHEENIESLLIIVCECVNVVVYDLVILAKVHDKVLIIGLTTIRTTNSSALSCHLKEKEGSFTQCPMLKYLEKMMQLIFIMY